MKKLLLSAFGISMLFVACKKEEEENLHTSSWKVNNTMHYSSYVKEKGNTIFAEHIANGKYASIELIFPREPHTGTYMATATPGYDTTLTIKVVENGNLDSAYTPILEQEFKVVLTKDERQRIQVKIESGRLAVNNDTVTLSCNLLTNKN